MPKPNKVSAIRIADEAFLVASTIERCPKTMMIRELFMNAIEAAIQAPSGKQSIEFRVVDVGGFKKLSLVNSGPGMSSSELNEICNLASSIGKSKGLDRNFGMGAKVASLPSNKYGLRYRSCKAGNVSEVILCEREGVYGRLRRQTDDGSFDEIFDVTNVCIESGIVLSDDWTEVVLFGNHAEQNTVRNPYDDNPPVVGQWLADYLYHRFYRLPEGLVVRFMPGTHKLDGSRTFRTIPDRAFAFGKEESITTPDGVIIHYFYDPPLHNTSHNKSVSGAMTTDVSICALVHKNEIFDIRRGRQWTLDAPLFGITFGAKHISIHVELPNDYAVRPEAYRQFLRYREGDQRQVSALDFAQTVLDHRPVWLIDVIASMAPADAGNTSDIKDELQKLLNALRVKARTPRIDQAGDVFVEQGEGRGASAKSSGRSSSGHISRVSPDDLLAVPTGAKRATVAMNAERAPDIIPLHDETLIDDKGLKGKAARFYSDTGQLFINMKYYSVDDMRKQLESEYAAAPDPEAMRRIALELAERTIMVRVGRAVVFALAKQLNREWSNQDMSRAQSPESLSLAADDFVDALQNARRRLGQALRSGKQESEPSPQSV